MGLMDELMQNAGSLTSQLSPEHAQLANGLLDHLTNNTPGGLPGLLRQLQQGGLASEVASWVGNGQNLPVSADQIQSVLGSGTVEALAGKLGISPEQVSAGLTQVLPKLVDHLTPNGEVPGSSSEAGGVLGAAAGFLKNRLGS